MTPSLVALHLSKASRIPLETVARARAVEGSGLEGDRHAKPHNRRALLVMDQEVLDQLGLAPGAVREQVTVQGLNLRRLVVGTRLRIGEVVLEVAAACAPCERMDEIRRGLKQELEGRRGRFVRVVRGGTLAVGDPILLEPPA